MEATVETLAKIYALEPLDRLCDECRDHATMRVIVLPPAVAMARATKPVHASVLNPARDDDELANATWEDAAWQ